MTKIYLDAGHGGKDPGASGHGLVEKDLTLDIVLRLRDVLKKQYGPVKTRLSRSVDSFVSLSGRTDDANRWGADYFVSVHINSFNGSASGYEDYIYDELKNGGTTDQYRDHIHHHVVKVNQLRDRGAKKENFHVLRESAMPAVLTENGFIDHSGDAKKLSDPKWRQAVAEGHAKGIAEIFDLKKQKTESEPQGSGGVGRMHRVIVDGKQIAAFQNDQNVIAAVKSHLGKANKIKIEKV